MSVIRINKTNNFTVMSNFHFREKDMSLKAKGLLSLMLSLPNDWDYSVSGLVKLSKDGKDSVMSALAELENFGYLTRTRTTNSKGQFNGIEYNIFEEPQPQKPIADNPILENENTEKPISAKPPQLNTNSIKHLNNQLYDLLTTKDERLLELYKEYIEMREKMNAPLTATGLENLISRCERLSKNNIRIQKILLENAIINNWKSVYLPREEELEQVNKEYVNEFKSFFELE
jgi:hypothetical protein